MQQAVDRLAPVVQPADEVGDGLLVGEVHRLHVRPERLQRSEPLGAAAGGDDACAGCGRARVAARPDALVAPAISTVRPVSPAHGQASVARMPAVDSMTPCIFLASASKNIDSGNSSSMTRSV